MAVRLYPSQETYLNDLGHRPYMFCEVGTGKTLMSLFRAHRAGATRVLVICPASVRDTKVWELDLAKSGLEFDAFEVKGYSFLQRYKDIDFSMYERYYIIIDEAHKIKNSQSKQGLGAFHLCTRTRVGYSLLSGTPMSNWSEAVNYAKLTGLVAHKTEFYRRFVVEQRYKGFPEIVGYVNTDELKRWWFSISLRLRASDCVELPKKHVIPVTIPINKTHYTRMLKTRMTVDGDALDNAPKLTWALRAEAETAKAKVAWVVDKVEGLDNCLVFLNTAAAITELSTALTKAGIEHGIWSGRKKDDFTKHDVMLVQYQAGGTGLNLQRFHNTIFMSPCYSYTDYTQAIGRTYRNGQSERCVFYELTADKTIDTAIYKALRAKQDFDDKLTGVDPSDIHKLMEGK